MNYHLEFCLHKVFPLFQGKHCRLPHGLCNRPSSNLIGVYVLRYKESLFSIPGLQTTSLPMYFHKQYFYRPSSISCQITTLLFQKIITDTILRFLEKNRSFWKLKSLIFFMLADQSVVLSINPSFQLPSPNIVTKGDRTRHGTGLDFYGP